MNRYRRFVAVLFSAILSVALTGGCASKNAKPERIQITKLDDLPQHTYPTSGSVVELVQSEEAIRALAEQVRDDIESDLATYEIKDATTLQRMYGTLQTIALLEGHNQAALARLAQIRALEDKEAKKLTAGLVTETKIAAQREAGADIESPAFREAFRRRLAEAVNALPWETVQDTIQENKGRMEILSENLIIGLVQARIEPAVAQTGELNAEQAASAISMHHTIHHTLPLKADILAVYQQAIDANKTVKADIWAERDVTLAADGDYAPVLVAAWDSGTDDAVFAERLFVNPGEIADGQDNDGNGFVDDIHGIAYDIHAQPTTGMLYPLGDAADRMPRVMNHMKGFTDLQSSVDSAEASALKNHLSGLESAAVQGFLEDLGLAGNYAHGTHVAGLMTAGNPYARLLIARLSYDHKTIPVARTVEWGERDAKKCRDTVAYFKQHGVRVVNMSWGESLDDAVSSLEANGIGKDAEERREIARQVFGLQKEGLHEAIKGAPDILFVCAAGNADNDVEFDEYIPSSFELPNLVTVGAVDQAGDPTSFTSFGKAVQVYANGFEVDSYVPGGQRMAMSGTSMASPNVANLAGKLLAINPTLTPAQVIDLIKRGADKKTTGSKTFLLMNPKRSVELARK